MSEELEDESEENYEEGEIFEGDGLEDEDEDDDSIHVDIDDDVAQGVYANLVISNYSREEFVLDFVFLQPQVAKGKIRSRVVLSPKNAKRLSILLNNHMTEYEKNFGSVTDDPTTPGIQFSIN